MYKFVLMSDFQNYVCSSGSLLILVLFMHNMCPKPFSIIGFVSYKEIERIHGVFLILFLLSFFSPFALAFVAF